MSFWNLSDTDKTADNVDAFLKGQIPRLARQAGVDLTTLSSPQLSFASAHANARNHTEENMYRGLNAMEALEAIRYTMDKTNGISPHLLIYLYIKEMPVWQIRQKLFIDHDSFRDYKKAALCQFADCWDGTQDVYKWESSERIDLHVYE